MSANWGSHIELSLFGESHGEAIGIVMGNLPAGIRLDMEQIRWYMKRRAPGQNKMSTPRQEKDEVHIGQWACGWSHNRSAFMCHDL